MKKRTISIVGLGFAVVAFSFLFPKLGALAETEGLSVTAIRAYADGNLHLFLDGNISTACGSKVRVQGAGQENVRALAMTAMVSGRTVTVETESAPSGNFCNLIYLRLDG